MKRLFFLSLIFSVYSLSAQVTTTTDPAIVVQQTGTAITVTFDVSKMPTLAGNAGPLYVHTGVLTVGSGDWKYVITPWPNGSNGASANISANTLTSLGSNKWKLTISPDINSYYGITNGDIVSNLAFVVRTADGSKQSSPDIFIPVYQAGLNVSITAPAKNSLVAANTATNITVAASNGSQSCTTNVYVGATTTANITGTTPVAIGTNSVSTSYKFTDPGNYYIIAKTTSGSLTKSDTAYICVPKAQVSAARPAGLKEGITKNSDGSVTFCFSLGYASPVSGSTQVFLLGDFNNFRPDNNYMMNRDAESTTYNSPTYFYWLTLPGLDTNIEYAYQYYVTGLSNNTSVRVGDPYCEKILDPNNDKYINQTYNIYPGLRPYPSQASGVLSCFQINAPQYQWQTTNFTPPAQNKLQIYEMLFRDFTTEGSVQVAIQKLDYLKDLGVNAVELMPIMEFDGNNSWGYNPNFYFATDKAYGTKQDYQQFIDECHKRGMAVILDIVFNHTWGLSPYCMIYWDAANNRPATTNPYYNAVAPHPYSVGNDLNHTYPAVKAWLSRAVQFWLTEYKADGFRFDLSKGFTQTPSTTSTCGNLDQSRINNIKVYIDAVRAVNPNAYNILEHFANDDEENTLAAYKNTMLWRNMSGSFQVVAKGQNSDLSGLVSTGGSLTLPTNRVAYAESHDEERLAYQALTNGAAALKDTATTMKQMAVCAAFTFLNPGPRMMWMFGELGYSYSINYNGGNVSPKPVRWDWLDEPNRKQLHDNYAKILNFRQKYSDLFDKPTTWNWQVNTAALSAGKRIYLQNSNITVVVLGNFSSAPVTANPAFGKAGTWHELLSGDSLTVTDPNMTLPLNPFDVRIYTDQAVNTGLQRIINSSVKVYPNPVIDNLYISGGGAKTIEVLSISGALVISRSVTGNAVSLASLPAGIYIGKITFNDGSLKIVKIYKK